MKYRMPGVGELEINTIILDLNGTVSVGGQLVTGVKERIDVLKKQGFTIVLFTGNTRGDADAISEELGIDWKEAHSAADKKILSDAMDPATCMSIGNGRIDKELNENVALGVVVLQEEGVHIEALMASRLIVKSVNDALDMLIDSKRLIASLRK